MGQQAKEGERKPIPFRRWTGHEADDGVFEQECRFLDVGVDATGATDDLAALCLSGGGIRSAAFAMGIVSGLAKHGLLERFHYLSTVSGGGYTGAWLSAWIHRHKDGLVGVVRLLSRRAGPASAVAPTPCTECGTEDEARLPTHVAGRNEPAPVRWVRTYCSYLSPRLGLLSLDTWTLVGIYVRNLIVNWAILVPLAAALLAVPHLAYGLTLAAWKCAQLAHPLVRPTLPLPTLCGSFGLANGLVVASFVLMAIALMYLHWQRPSGLSQRRDQNVREIEPAGQMNYRFGQGGVPFVLWCVLPLLVAMTLLSPWLLAQVAARLTLAVMVIFGAAANGLAWAGAAALEAARSLLRDHLATAADPPTARRHAARPLSRVGYGLATIASGALGGAGTLAAAAWIRTLPGLTQPVPTRFPVAWPLLVGPWLFVLVWMLASTLFIGIASLATDDQDREFWARGGSNIVRWTIVGFAVSVICLYAPHVWLRMLRHPGALARIVDPLGGVTGALTLLGALAGAMSPLTSAVQGRDRNVGPIARLVDGLVKFLAPLSLLMLMTVGAAAVGTIVLSLWTLSTTWVQRLWPGAVCGPSCLLVAVSAGFGIGLGAFALAVSRVIALREFSLHALYRERLARTFLGASHGVEASEDATDDAPRPRRTARRGPSLLRIPNAFTGFDPEDDLPMADLVHRHATEKDAVQGDAPDDGAPADKGGASRSAPPRLLPVINVTLNATRFSEANLARQHRKALPFTITPLHAGCADGDLGYRPIGLPPSAFRKSAAHTAAAAAEPYGGGPRGISLATAMTLSGAAASPNMGYHSSPSVTLLLSLFNLRLGRWLGNPGRRGGHTYHKDGPDSDLQTMVLESLSQVDTNQAWVYLSDGGHFDNLGLYEMVRRRCRVIVVADASADPTYAYNDLARTLQAIRTDLGIRIDIIGRAGCADEAIAARPGGGGLKHLMRHGAESTRKEPWVGVPARVILARICYGGDEAGGDRSPTAARAVDGAFEARPGAGDGLLIYLKPIVCPDDPVELVNRKLRAKTFPHDSTLHQLFDERTFESYRLLGQHTIAWLMEGSAAPVPPDDDPEADMTDDGVLVPNGVDPGGSEGGTDLRPLVEGAVRRIEPSTTPVRPPSSIRPRRRHAK